MNNTIITLRRSGLWIVQRAALQRGPGLHLGCFTIGVSGAGTGRGGAFGAQILPLRTKPSKNDPQ